MTGPSAHPGWELAPGWGAVDRPGDGDHGGRLYVAPLLSGEITVLEGAAASVARAALAGHGLAQIPAAVAAELGVEVPDVETEVVGELLQELVELGALTVRDRS
ncbi:hypothetical protein [Ornithinimicrobium tianjinense]|uniref:Uncharacterized protein n=1 Tax=Ornithinimicrobium tianjinense TaxID=1195761 RepID=A0A917BR12_9MICO|nr:hypothetical protein [Ornithinimicrobium tianjinense]GGF53596.1 hypothetical protein GCM10011366_21750 [Ornithinimicrobium tianjinense]